VYYAECKKGRYKTPLLLSLYPLQFIEQLLITHPKYIIDDPDMHIPCSLLEEHRASRVITGTC